MCPKCILDASIKVLANIFLTLFNKRVKKDSLAHQKTMNLIITMCSFIQSRPTCCTSSMQEREFGTFIVVTFETTMSLFLNLLLCFIFVRHRNSTKVPPIYCLQIVWGCSVFLGFPCAFLNEYEFCVTFTTTVFSQVSGWWKS